MGRGHRSRSNFWRAAVDITISLIRGLALPSEAYQSKVFVCVYVCKCTDNSTDAVDRLLLSMDFSCSCMWLIKYVLLM